MPNIPAVLSILLLLPLALSTVLSAEGDKSAGLGNDLHAAQGTADHAVAPSRPHGHAIVRVPRSIGVSGTAADRPPRIGISTVNLDVHPRRVNSAPTLGRRSGGNGKEVHLGTAFDTFVVPVSIGIPGVTYPLQLDLASSDLLLASTLCTDSSCPKSLGPSTNPYYDVSRHSAGLQEVNSNTTGWNTSYADATVASGFLIRDRVVLGTVEVEGQVIGLINSTNLTLSEQKISGILGLGFPRLSSLSRALFEASGTSSGSAKSNTTYLPPLLEHLVQSPDISYPVFALALAPPPSNGTSTSASSAAPSSSARYRSRTGSLTLGGVSSLYVSNDTTSGRTVDDIEWHEVMPFGRAATPGNDTGGNIPQGDARTTVVSSSAAESASATSASTSTYTAASQRKRSKPSELDGAPSSVAELGDEEYLFWALALHNVSVNGSDVGLQSSYASIGLPSVALLDAGFNGIAGPQQDVVRLFSKIQDARQVSEGRWAVPCSTQMTIGFSFGGRHIQLQPSDWMYASVAQSSFCLAWPIVAPASGDGIDWQLGTPFLKRMYSVFSYGINGNQPPLVGFLPLESGPIAGTNHSTTVSTTQSSDSSAPRTIESLSLSLTIDTVLPNALLPDPTYPTPTYIFSATPSVLQPGVTQYLGLANASAYSVGPVPVVTMDKSASSRAAAMGGGEATGGAGSGGDSGSGAGSSGAVVRCSVAGGSVLLAVTGMLVLLC
ncbi:hypothetical protein IAU60_006648 [Kwoniella sp. DSM 27419]